MSIIFKYIKPDMILQDASNTDIKDRRFMTTK